MKILSVVGARPNFMKVAPFIRSINNYNKTAFIPINHYLVHTGQHYDDRMSKSFFDALNIPEADINLGIGSGTHAEQVGRSMIELEKVFAIQNPDWVVVFGDVNATIAAAITAKKLNIKICHIEAGLRSGDMKMPEEINRIVTDRLSDLLLTPDRFSIDNLKAEGIPNKRIHFVGNIMIDTLELNRAQAEKLSIYDIVYHNQIIHTSNYQIRQSLSSLNQFALVTLHRPSNVDKKDILKSLVDFLVDEASQKITIIWTVHPRTQKQLRLFNLWDKVCKSDNIYLLHPLDYHSMLKLNMQAQIMLTDSGGLQEECTVLGTPCITMRWNTERPVTLREYGGASVLVGNDILRIREEFNQTLYEPRNPERPELWDGHTADRCLGEIIDYT